MEYILRDSHGTIFYFFVSNNKLYYKQILNDNTTKTIPISIIARIKHFITVDIDTMNIFHIVFVTTDNKLGYISYSNAVILKTSYINYNMNLYSLNSLRLLCLKNTPILLFSATNTQSKRTELFFVNLDNSSDIMDILYLDNHNTNFSVIACNDTIHLLCVNYEQTYSLNLFTYSSTDNSWSFQQKIVSHTHDISNFSLCTDSNNNLHAIYILEEIRGSKLYYVNLTTINDKQEIIASSHIDHCTIFVLKQIVWIHWNEGSICHTCFLYNDCTNCSAISLSSLQVNLVNTVYFKHNVVDLYGNVFLGSVNNRNIYIGVIEDIIPNILPMKTSPSKEMLLVLNTLGNNVSKPSVNKNDELQEAHDYIELIEKQYTDLQAFAVKLQNEAKKWKKMYHDITSKTKSITMQKQELEAEAPKTPQNEEAT